MSSRYAGRTAFTRLIALIALGAMLLCTAPAGASQGTLAFQATVSGKAHDSGSFTHDESTLGGITYTGCAVIKQPAHYYLGKYTFVVRTTGIYLAGIKPAGSGVFLTVEHFRPTAKTSNYKGLDVSGTFAINGHSYGDGVKSNHQAVHITGGGLSGTWTDPTANRNYPAKILGAIPGFKFQARWHCTTLLHVSG